MHFAVPAAFTCSMPVLDDTGTSSSTTRAPPEGHRQLQPAQVHERDERLPGAVRARAATSSTTPMTPTTPHAHGARRRAGGEEAALPVQLRQRRLVHVAERDGGHGLASGHGPRALSEREAHAVLRSAHAARRLQILVRTPRVGFFSTPAFFANWTTNKSNQHRDTLNQALVVGIGRSINPVDRGTSTVLDNGKDGQHSDPTSPCYSCHQTMDPMRNVFRQAYTYSYHAQHDATQVFSTASFDYLGEKAPLTSSTTSRMPATHPLYASAWTAEALLLRQLQRVRRGRSGVPARRAGVRRLGLRLPQAGARALLLAAGDRAGGDEDPATTWARP